LRNLLDNIFDIRIAIYAKHKEIELIFNYLQKDFRSCKKIVNQIEYFFDQIRRNIEMMIYFKLHFYSLYKLLNNKHSFDLLTKYLWMWIFFNIVQKLCKESFTFTIAWPSRKRSIFSKDDLSCQRFESILFSSIIFLLFYAFICESCWFLIAFTKASRRTVVVYLFILRMKALKNPLC